MEDNYQKPARGRRDGSNGRNNQSTRRFRQDRPFNGNADNNRGDRDEHRGYKRRSGDDSDGRTYRGTERGNGDRPYRGHMGDNRDGDRPRRGYNREGEERQNRASRFAGRNPKGFFKKKTAAATGVPSAPNVPTHASKGLIRLNKYISNAGICSRRDADKLIEAGSVMVNGEIVTQMGYLVKEGDVVTYDGQTLKSETKRYILLNKPKGYITTLEDQQGRQTVMDLVEGACRERIYPVGRLDRNTTGLLLFTNDGELSKKLTHPSSGVYKVYQVEVDHPVTRKDMQKMLDGIELEDGPIHVDDVQYAQSSDHSGIDKRIVGVQLHSGKNRIVRRIFESLGYTVHKLDRTVFAGLTKKDLPRGRYRELTEKEVGFLKMI